MQRRMFAKTEEFIEEAMKTQLIEAIAQAGTEEKQHAIDNRLPSGVPAVSVVADGRWSKRSHNHSFNTKSGVAVIFGAYMKMLFMGVCNKFCSICAVSEKQKPATSST